MSQTNIIQYINIQLLYIMTEHAALYIIFNIILQVQEPLGAGAGAARKHQDIQWELKSVTQRPKQINSD